MIRTTSRWASTPLLLLACGALAACAEGGRDRRDAAVRADTGFVPIDAPFLLDAPFVSPDTGTSPDAHVVGSPDAVVVLPDAFVPGADAFVPPVDAFTPVPPDAFSPDAFTPGADAFSSCSESPCRILAPQCGCGAGESCYPSGTTRVCAVPGTRLEGSGCAGITDCATGMGCVNFSSDAAAPGNMCARVCATDADCASGALCIHTIGDGLGGEVPGLRFCSRPCTPAPSAGCAPGLACTLFQESTGAMRIFTDCAGPVGSGRQDAPCVDETDCAAGFGCFNTGLGNACLSWCRVASPSCPVGTTCQSVGIAGGVEWGACA
ncbi:MAG: hypothetical protein U0353_35115 [Sandaracinus sp.]|jgi:hypothetical protein